MFLCGIFTACFHDRPWRAGCHAGLPAIGGAQPASETTSPRPPANAQRSLEAQEATQLLGAVLLATTGMSRLFGFSRADEITIVFCGSKKSLASGLPMASVLFAGQSLGLVVLPLMLFHQIQLMVCAALARRYGAEAVGPNRQLQAVAIESR